VATRRRLRKDFPCVLRCSWPRSAPFSLVSVLSLVVYLCRCVTVKSFSDTMLGYARGTVMENPSFNVQDAAKRLREAMKGLGTNERVLIDVLCSHSNRQRQMIRAQFQGLFGRDLVKDIEKETSGRFEEVLIALLTPSYEYLAICLQTAFQGMGTDDNAVVELLCSRTPTDIQAIKQAYHSKYGKPLESRVNGELSGTYKKVILSILAGQRDQSTWVDESRVMQDVSVIVFFFFTICPVTPCFKLFVLVSLKELVSAGVGKWGTDESVFNMIICNRSYAHLQRISQQYIRQTGRNLTDDISREFSGHAKAALIAIVQTALDAPLFFAQKIHDALKGLGTKDNVVIRVLVTRSEIDLEDIKQRYVAMYKCSLVDAIRKDTSGDYEKVLVRLLGA
ncbi:unnamed protein product, partial [Darwinula stevensoni]